MKLKILKEALLISGLALMITAFGSLPLKGQNKDNHYKYDGQILFSPVEITGENVPAAFKKNFNAGEAIYARVYLDKPLYQYYQDYGWDFGYDKAKYKYNYAFEIYIDGKKAIQWLNMMPETQFKNGDFEDVVILPHDTAKYTYSMFVSDWRNAIEGLKDGDHQVKVDFSARDVDHPASQKPPLAVGTFTLTINQAGLAKLKKDYDLGLPKSTIDDPGLMRDILEATTDLYPGWVPVQASIIQPTGQFEVHMDNKGVITNRTFIAVVALKGMENICSVKTALYEQHYKGESQWGKVRLAQELDGYYNYKAPCKYLEK